MCIYIALDWWPGFLSERFGVNEPASQDAKISGVNTGLPITYTVRFLFLISASYSILLEFPRNYGDVDF